MVLASAFLAFSCLIPSFIFMLSGIHRIDIMNATVQDGDTNLALLVSYVLWLYGGFFSLGSLAGEVRNERF